MFSPEFLLTALVVVLIPGTGVVYTVVVGMASGRRASLAAAFGCMLGILPALLGAAFGLSALLHESALAFQTLKYAGAAYLLYLAFQTLRERGPLKLTVEPTPNASFVAVARQGCLINVLNPKLTVFFLAFLPQFIVSGAGSASAQIFELGAVFMAMTLAVFVVYGVTAAWLGQFLLQSRRAMDWMRRSVAVVFAGLSLKLALSRQ